MGAMSEIDIKAQEMAERALAQTARVMLKRNGSIHDQTKPYCSCECETVGIHAMVVQMAAKKLQALTLLVAEVEPEPEPSTNPNTTTIAADVSAQNPISSPPLPRWRNADGSMTHINPNINTPTLHSGIYRCNRTHADGDLCWTEYKTFNEADGCQLRHVDPVKVHAALSTLRGTIPTLPTQADDQADYVRGEVATAQAQAQADDDAYRCACGETAVDGKHCEYCQWAADRCARVQAAEWAAYVCDSGC